MVTLSSFDAIEWPVTQISSVARKCQRHLAFLVPSFQLSLWRSGWLVVSRVCRVSVCAINRSTSGFPNVLVFCCCMWYVNGQFRLTIDARPWQCTQLKAGPRTYAHGDTLTARTYAHTSSAKRGLESWDRMSSVCLSVCPSVYDVGDLIT